GCRDVATVPGFRQTSDEPGWEEGLKYYFFMGLSRLVKLPGKPFEHHRKPLTDEVIRLQRNDGSWKNKSDRMREDDPHIATCFGLIALANLLGEN
ncbi:MAG: hypothetical protein AAF802_24290, partial [Planctomycetota bacterium]